MLRGGALSFCRSSQICERVRVGLENFKSTMKDPMNPLGRPLDLMLLEKDSEPLPPDHVKDDCFNPDLDSPITKRMRLVMGESRSGLKQSSFTWSGGSGSESFSSSIRSSGLPSGFIGSFIVDLKFSNPTRTRSQI